MSVTEQVIRILADKPKDIRLTRQTYSALLDEITDGVSVIYRSDEAVTAAPLPPGAVMVFMGVPVYLVD